MTDSESIEYRLQKIFFKTSEDMSDLPDGSVTLVVTSPPYWNVRDYGGEQLGFNQSYQEYITSLNRVWAQCIQKLQPNGKLAVNFQPLPISGEDSGFNRRIILDIMWDVQKFMFSQDLYLSGMHYWDKSAYINNVAWGSYPKPTNIHSNTSFEQIYVFVKPGKTRSIDANLLNRNLLSKDEWRHWAVRCIWDDISPVIKINSKGENNFGHTAPFPEDIPYRLIRMHTVEGEIVLDPFLGSGTTLKVCRLTNRNGIGYEINADYKDRILQRIDETWEPPSIDSIYLSMGLEKLKAIIETTINTTLSSKNQNETNQIDYNELLAHVAKQLSKEKLLSKNIIKKLTNNSEDEE